MPQRKAPYTHPDGSNCWTPNCSRGHVKKELTEKEKFIQQMLKQQKLTNPDVATIDLIAPFEKFQQAVKDGRITGQNHPEYPYVIYKYSQATTYARDWDEITLASRGLVVNKETGEIVVRPFKKFFNYTENLTPEHLLTGDFVVADKLDGSLGLLFRNPKGEYEITTAGGFQSEQAAHATKIYQERYAGKWNLNPNLSYHYEILYPQNRIVCDYGDTDDIYLLGAVNKKTGRSVPLSQLKEWKWNRAEEFNDFSSLNDVQNAEDPGISREGYIVHFTETDTRVKFKFAEYLQVHKLATGLNARRIHAELKAGGKNLEEFKMNAPEEFKDYIETEEAKLTSQFKAKKQEILGAYKSVVDSLPADADQKTFAIAVQKSVPKEYLSQMFTIRSRGAVNEEKIWDSIEPPFEKGFWAAGNGVE